MKILIIIVILINILVYTAQYISWRKDCKKYGKEKLAVPLEDRIFATAMVITFPCILGLLRR